VSVSQPVPGGQRVSGVDLSMPRNSAIPSPSPSPPVVWPIAAIRRSVLVAQRDNPSVLNWWSGTSVTVIVNSYLGRTNRAASVLITRICRLGRRREAKTKH